MRQSYANRTTPQPHAPRVVLCALLSWCLVVESRALAQEPTPPLTPATTSPMSPPAPQVVDFATPAAPAPEPVPAGEPTAGSAADIAADIAALKAELAETKAKLEQVQTRQDDVEAAALTSVEEPLPKQDLLRVYGFADMGVQHLWVDERSLIANVFATNSTSFVIGNVNLYFDAQPVEHWRSLVEVRFTNAPLGDTATYGGIAGTYQRKDTFSYDPHGTAINAPMWAAAVVLERAWIEWNEQQAFKLRVGNWFTPFGIWNADHGTPTLISIALPQFITQRWMPIRQTGVMAYGNTFVGEWELGYALTFSNGRQELSNLNFEDKFGYGGRLYLRREAGSLNTTLGTSYFTGTTSDRSVDVTGVNPVTFDTPTVWEYHEHVLGADVAVDIDMTRIRAEAMVRRQTFTPGLRAPGDPVFAAGSVEADKWQHSAYVLVAHQLPWLGLEPFVWLELLQSPTVVADGTAVMSAGLNVHFNAAVQLKTQVTRGVFFDWRYEAQRDPSIDDLTQIYSRLVMAF
jgi:hypothetical protein